MTRYAPRTFRLRDQTPASSLSRASHPSESNAYPLLRDWTPPYTQPMKSNPRTAQRKSIFIFIASSISFSSNDPSQTKENNARILLCETLPPNVVQANFIPGRNQQSWLEKCEMKVSSESSFQLSSMWPSCSGGCCHPSLEIVGDRGRRTGRRPCGCRETS